MIETYSHNEHFELLRDWNNARKQFGLERWMLPDFGLVIDDIAMAFLVTTNSPVAWIAHWSVRPELSKEDRDRAINDLTKEFEKISKEKGFRLLQTLGKSGFNLSYRLRKNGFIAADGEFTFFVKDLGA